MRVEDVTNGKCMSRTDPILSPGYRGQWDDFASITPAVFTNINDKNFGMFDNKILVQ